MIATTPIERVANVLELAHFRRMPTPIQIAGLEFKAPAAFVAQSPSPDLVVIGDTVSQTPRELQQVVEGAGRALDTVGSRRPLTLVVVGPRPDSGVLTALSRHARVLPVGEAADESSLRNWLAVLMPLKLPTIAGGARHVPASIDALGTISDPLAKSLLEVAAQGVPGDVAEVLYDLIEAPFDGFDFEDGTETLE